MIPDLLKPALFKQIDSVGEVGAPALAGHGAVIAMIGGQTPAQLQPVKDIALGQQVILALKVRGARLSYGTFTSKVVVNSNGCGAIARAASNPQSAKPLAAYSS